MARLVPIGAVRNGRAPFFPSGGRCSRKQGVLCIVSCERKGRAFGRCQMRRIQTVLFALLLPGLACADFRAEGGLYLFVAPVLKAWWDPAYGFRRRIVFGTDHSELAKGFTASIALDSTADAGVASPTGADVRIVRYTAEGGNTELDRIGSAWNTTNTALEFRLADVIPANANEAAGVTYYLYLGNPAPSAAPEKEKSVYYFADFFGRSNGAAVSTTDVGNGWTEWNNGVSDFRIQSGILYGHGNDGSIEAGVQQDFALGPIPGKARLTFDWHVVGIVQATWGILLNLGDSTMTFASLTTGVGPGLYFGEDAPFNPNVSIYNMDHNLGGAGQLENTVLAADTDPYTTLNMRIDINCAAGTFDYYRGGVLRSAGATFVNPIASLTRIRMAVDNYAAGLNPMGYDNIKLKLLVDNDPEVTLSPAESLFGP